MSKKPNIILFNPDQWRSDVMGHLGNPAAKAPTLDRLAQADAVSFSHAFCLYLSLHNPHVPFGVEKPWYGSIELTNLPERIPVPNWETKPAILRGLHERMRLEQWENEADWNELRATYFEQCSRVDWLFGKVIETLKTQGLYEDTAIVFWSDHGEFNGDYGLVEKTQNTFEDELELQENTLVVFTSDNGGLSTAETSPTCNHPLAEGKGWCYEGGTRVCQIVRWPSVVAPASRCDIPVTSTDFYPTFLQACGADLLPEQHSDGVSLLPLLQQSDAFARDAIFWHYPHYSNQGGKPAASILSGDWKLIEDFESGVCELYNLAVDISETKNRAEEEPEITSHLYSRLKQWQQEIEARIPEPNPGWESKLKRPQVPNNACV